MNNEFADLENDLRAFQPLSPSAALEERLALTLDAAAVQTPAIPWWQQLGFHRPLAAFTWGLATPAAAVCAVLLLRAGGVAGLPSPGSTDRRSPSPLAAVAQTSSGGFEADAVSNVVYQTNDEGVVYNAQQEPSRQVRYRSEETLAWHNPRTGTQVEVSYPREEVVMTPIALR